MPSKGFPNQRPELFQDCASGGAYGGVDGGYTYLLPGSIAKVAYSSTNLMIATMIKEPRVDFRYWVLASLLAETFGILFFDSFLCHLAFPIIYVAQRNS